MSKFFDTWLDASEETDQRKTLWRATEAGDKRSGALSELILRTRSHYVKDEEIATFLDTLGYDGAAEIIRTNYPEGPTCRSGDLGEILCAEVIEEWCDFEVPIRKLRFKDHRDQAMRGEDVIGVGNAGGGQLRLLKAEAKSAQALSTGTVQSAREGLDANSGRPTAHSLIFLARRLIEMGNAKAELGKKILIEAVSNAVPKNRIAHCLFTITGNPAVEMLDDDFVNADGTREQYIIHIQIPDHAKFVEQIFEGVNNLALD
jgi:hypothetical protein